MMKLFYKNQRLGLWVVASVLALPVLAEQPSEGFLSWYPRADLTPTEQATLPSFCSGAYRVPAIPLLEGGVIEAEADSSQMHRSGSTELSGNVMLQQYDRLMHSDEAEWDQNNLSGRLSGHVSLHSPQLVLYGAEAQFDDQRGEAQFSRAQYAVPSNHMRGTAAHINAKNSGQMQLKSATMTFCEPGHQDWDIAASTLNLDNEKGVGSAWNTRLRIQEVPVLYFPYYYFPLDDRRLTGFLDPSLSLTGKLQADDIQVPFYWNIAPNYDATITPHQVREHGLVWETQFRHLTSLLGEGEANYAVLNNDDTLGTKRWFLNYQQQGSFGHGWQHRWVYNQVSDQDYFNDTNPTEATDRSTHLPRRGEIVWDQRDWHADVTVEAFQTIDELIPLANRPYERLPQFNLSYSPLKVNQWQFQQRLQVTRFSRDTRATLQGIQQDLSGFASLNGDRILSDTRLAYPLEWPFGFFTPMVEYRHRSYELYDLQLTPAQAANPELFNLPESRPQIGSARYSLDGGLYFEREITWFNAEYQQTFEPRLYWIKSPLVKGQDSIPNFDSADLTVTYASLFTGERFTGGDRLADLDQVSAGATTRFIRDDGLEQLRLSVGQIFYQRDREVLLNGAIKSLVPAPPSTVPTYDRNQTHSSSVLAEAEWNPNAFWSLQSTLEWDPYKKFARQERYGVRFEDGHNHMLNLAYNAQREWRYNSTYHYEEHPASLAQVDAGIFWSLSDRWAVFGRMLVDVKDYQAANASLNLRPEAKPIDARLESLAGVEYQNCCWRLQLTYRETSLQETSAPLVGASPYDPTFSTRKDYGFLFSIQLKGLGTFGKKTDTLISEAIPGYSRRIYHDF